MTDTPTIDAVKMVREIRDRLQERTRGMTPEQVDDFYNRSAARFREQALAELKERSAISRSQDG
jgi:hypothetical protein